MDTRRLTRDDWLTAALKALAESGPDSLKPDRLARTLGVSRGSFYWHFADVTAFHHAIFERWELVAVDTPLDRSSASEGQSAEAALQRLIAIAFTAPSALERAVFRWAVSYPLATAAVKKVNARRLVLLETMFAATGQHREAMATNARILYWAYLGRVLLDDEVPDDRAVDQISELFGLGRTDQG
jgi:AcrR family transcriptional regulator